VYEFTVYYPNGDGEYVSSGWTSYEDCKEARFEWSQVYKFTVSPIRELIPA